MELSINGKTEVFDQQMSLIDLLQIKGVSKPETVAVELNGHIVVRKEYSATILQEKDQIEVIYFMGGGEGPEKGRLNAAV